MPRLPALAAALAVTLGAWVAAFRPGPGRETVRRLAPAEAVEVVRTEKEWRQRLSPLQFQVLREKGTERAFTGRYWDHRAAGTYRCAACAAPVFSSDAKYDSGTGWPSFWQPASPGSVATAVDESLFEKRIEVLCRRCGGHLGHVFEDGPPPTGLRYCVNSASLEFEPRR